jgi:hypothetical protein
MAKIKARRKVNPSYKAHQSLQRQKLEKFKPLKSNRSTAKRRNEGSNRRTPRARRKTSPSQRNFSKTRKSRERRERSSGSN